MALFAAAFVVAPARCFAAPSPSEAGSTSGGRAVSRAGAGEWADRMLPLSPALVGLGEGGDRDILDGLQVTGHFHGQHFAPTLGDRPLPAARQRFIDLIARGVRPEGDAQ